MIIWFRTDVSESDRLAMECGECGANAIIGRQGVAARWWYYVCIPARRRAGMISWNSSYDFLLAFGFCHLVNQHDTRLSSSLIHPTEQSWIWHLLNKNQSFQSNRSLISGVSQETGTFYIGKEGKSKSKKVKVVATLPPLSLWNTWKSH